MSTLSYFFFYFLQYFEFAWINELTHGVKKFVQYADSASDGSEGGNKLL